ncbi:nicotinate-nucleotide--dimethylbenzimidazole phosphoribosyltransferase [Cohnella nanjingensis]|uniref:Nicotinate-nucleotide--dimethylbenzimidazole phosphoribosyltransferase n=1 Tax=Cohnella nanjingensis TaxID=1387779 RepID=A0A7X0VJA0_9BACL|nr:nicotinate-nucleotide--dimethylbenzimidazole phosphoribosyltransferase [Cohnella nanjingensis]MBB6675353.1 nicotinate-nucleotide--dimethylbenzimidazole phosphoribosyltransferase [Cohnella nanjingensis]
MLGATAAAGDTEAGEKLDAAIRSIGALDEAAMREAAARLDQLIKPPGSLGRLEELAIRLAGITGTPVAERPLRKAVVVMAGDHGVCDEGVSAFPQEVTPQMVLNFLQGGAAINVLARQTGAEVVCVDIGVKGDLAHERLLSRRVRGGTANMARGAAMTREEAIRALVAGIEVAEELAERGYGLFATGEMGIGNTTPSAALLAVWGGLEAKEVVGRGTGIDDAGLARKREAVERAIAVNRPDEADPLDVLSKLGGLEIAGLAGVIIGAASRRCPVVIDGFISTVAALAACKLAPGAEPYLIASHLSEERGHGLALRKLGLAPMLHLGMRLGEGTGAALVFPLIDAAGGVLREMATFDSAGVSKG